jgi:predicted restriction endonuclease
VEYQIGGLGLPVSYGDGYFLIEGPHVQDLNDSLVPSQRIHVISDERVKTLRSIVQRQGQGVFRRRLLEAYGGRCALTGYDAEGALEAAHIRPYSGPFSNDVRNGLLLRSDIHTLFDLRQVGIEPRTKEFVLCDGLKRTRYSDLDGCHVRLPADRALQPGADFLNLAWEEFRSS